MKRTTFITTTAGVAATMAGANATVSGALAAMNESTSDFTLRTARADVTGIIADLETAQTDYAGHRVAAINDYKSALTELDAALKYAHADVPPQRMSDLALRYAQQQTSSLVNSLKAAATDYGGHRVKAIHDLEQANAEITAALATK